jgi:serine/threonine protein phosphatase PrpC
MPQPEPHQSACPACAEPLEPGDLFCGACGTAAAPVLDNGPGEPREAPAPAAVPDPREELRAGEPPAASGRPVCVACGLGGVDADGYCEHCGHAQPRPRDHQELELEGVAAVSDRGLRHHRNEDAFAVSTTRLPDGTPTVVAMVCDGVSSASRPDDASAAAADTVNESLLDALEHGAAPEEAMRKALVNGAQAVTDLASEGPAAADPFGRSNAPACTCVSAVTAADILTVGWVGDSRAYWIPDDRARPSARLTEDDSWAARMVAAGIMSEEEAYADERAHAITGWFGADAVELDPHTASFQPDEPGVVVVCTDGLWNYAESSAELASVVPADARTRPLHAARTLVGVALDGGGHDNITVAVLPFPTTVGQAAETHP